MPKKDEIYKFKIALEGISPQIWRRILVPADYSFWDLHVAIQDSMGWSDSHLHMFRERQRKGVEIGIPDDDGFEDAPVVIPCWKIPISKYFRKCGDKMMYDYDFGDGWTHTVDLEEILPKEKGGKYPRCIAGERACPPEDCGGTFGYQRILEILKNPKHKEYESTMQWFEDSSSYMGYDPEAFVPEDVHFWNPKERLKMMMEG